MQPGVVTSGCVLELHAARANGGTTQQVNSPLGTQWYDTSGNAQHGTLTGFTGQTPWGGAGTTADPYRCAFDGSDDYAACPDLSAAEDKTFTYEAWYATTNGAKTNPLVSEANHANDNVQVLLSVGAGGLKRLSAGIGDDSGAGAMRVLDTVDTNDGLIHHAVMTCDGSYIRLYRDGGSVGTPVAPPAGTVTLTRTSVGAFMRLSPVYGDSRIPVARIYNRALSAAEVAQNYSAGPTWRDPRFLMNMMGA